MHIPRKSAFCRIASSSILPNLWFCIHTKKCSGNFLKSDLESYTWIVLWSILHKKQLFLTRTTFVIRLILLEWIIFISNSFPNDSSFDVAQHVFIYFGFDSVLQCQFALYLLENIIIYSSRQINAVKKLVLHFKNWIHDSFFQLATEIMIFQLSYGYKCFIIT